MAGNKKNSTAPIQTAQSTPLHQKDGVVAKLPLAALATYEVNIRAFHPNKNFENRGFRFHGDNRGFSLGKSWFEDEDKTLPTSRIWQRYKLDMNINEINVNKIKEITRLKTESNFSGPGPGIWRVLSINGEEYKNPLHKPRGKLEFLHIETPHSGQKIIRLKSHLAGENHAFISSSTQQKYLKSTAVPTLDVFNELFVRVERVSLYMDISTVTYGDGFPNCESYITDSAGKKLFLGSHVRIGYPTTHLWGEQKRFIWANTLRIEIDKNGNFGEKLWIFTQFLGGPPTLREDYPYAASEEIQSRLNNTPTTVSMFNLKNKNRGKFLWNYADPQIILNPKKNKNLTPLYISSFTNSPELINDVVSKIWTLEPQKKTTLSEWNDYHLHRDPNEGRARDDDDYQIDDKKWKK